MNSSAAQVLQQYWNYSSFRQQQEEIIHALIEGKDVLAIMPTGGGKSLCYQVPAMMQEGVCLVISPLIALMKDQVSQLKHLGISAAALHSGMSAQEVKYVLQQATHGDCKLLYVSPERLQSNLFKDYFPAFNLNLVAVDEAHCISQWGYDFRPPYLQIAEVLKEIETVPLIALTASATKDVQSDIIEKLEMRSPLVIRQSFARPNLSYSVLRPESKMHKVTDVLQKVNGSAIVYCNSRKQTKQTADLLQLQQISAAAYHAGLSYDERTSVQEAWMNNEIRTVACTNAFGMGINKPDVRTVVHYNTPDCLENYYQEAGRAGRDGKTSFAVLLCDDADIQLLKDLPTVRFPSVEQIKKIYQSIADYLQIPVGSGEGSYFDFDLKEFCSNFSVPVTVAMNALSVLQSEGFVSFNESVFLPSKIQFTTDHDHLSSFGKLYEQHDELIKVLLRTYPGIFDEETNVYEKQLARIMRQSTEQIEKRLHALHQYKIINYKQKKETPQIFLLTNRAPAAYLNINEENYRKRRALYADRVDKMIAYIQTNTCRSKFIATYFGEDLKDDCGVCDNCLFKKQQLTTSEFTEISEAILRTLRFASITAEQLVIELNFSKTKTNTVLHQLISEEKIYADAENKLHLKK